MKVAVALGVVSLLLAGCDPTPGPAPLASASPTPAANLGLTQAGDLRTHLDLILGEQVMIAAKETVAAVNHSDEYAAYTALLTANAADLTQLMRRAFGNTTATKISEAWSTQNSDLIDYAIGVVTHDDARSKSAMTNLTTKFVPQFSQLLSDASHLPLDPVTQLESQQVLEDKAFIDDYFANKVSAFYADLHRAYTQSSRLGDALAVEVASTVSALFASSTGALSAPLVAQWTNEHSALFTYAAGDARAKPDLTQKFVNEFASLAHVSKAYVLDHVNATLKVIDDQRAKNATAVANDDRSAATSNQPIGDSIQG
ncbi:MAG: hypothetical protein E6I17_12385 [Chloroflexi bacterium]|nr:MAG: hypothetical protein E6I17_12385 [Chloroflexota bacterium]